MKYICSDCGHKANGASKGLCPACSSNKFSRADTVKNDTATSVREKKSIIDNPFILIGVLIVLAYAIYDLVKNS